MINGYGYHLPDRIIKPAKKVQTPTAGVLFLWVCRDSREAAQGVQPLVAAKPPYRSAGKSPCAEIKPSAERTRPQGCISAPLVPKGFSACRFPVHELIHAVSFPAGSEVIMFYTTQGLGTTCTSPMTRNRFIVVNMLPSLILGVVPLIAYMIVPRTYAFASAVLCVFSLVHVGTGYVDYLNIVHLLRLPADSKIQISGAKIYWM